MRRGLLTLVILFVLGLLGVGWSFTPATLPAVTLPRFAPPVARGPAGVSLHAIKSGAMESQAAFAFRGGAFADHREFVMGGILVRHPQGNLLFDTGFGRNVDAHVASSPFPLRSMTKYTKGTPVADQLRGAGISPGSLKGIVLTHAHWDHVSGLDDMREATVWVSPEEAAFIRTDVPHTALIRSFGALHYHEYAFSSGPYLGFERSYDLFGDGSVVLVHAGGHTPGSVIPFITTADGKRYALLGDIVWQREGVDLARERPWLSRLVADQDAARVRVVIERMHALKKRLPGLVIVPAHDDRVWSTLPRL